jgi:biotin transport system ATP-binding protein
MNLSAGGVSNSAANEQVRSSRIKERLFSVKNLTKIFPGNGTEIRALDGINLDIFAGQCLVIAGSNGSGKTLLTRIIMGLIEPSTGEVFFRGRPLNGVLRELRSAAGLVFQDADSQFIGETVLEDAAFGPRNLGLSRTEAEDRALAALEAAGLSGRAACPPRSLSGGEKRRLAVAGVLAMGCETVIMDEPFANLDWPGIVQVLEIIRELKESGKTAIILTHELEKVLAFAGRLVILHRGRLQADGEPEVVLDRLESEYGVRDPRRAYPRVEDCTWLA